MASEQNNEINSLIQNLTYNNEIEASITKNGGKIVYAYNNIIMATEISDTFYVELSKNPYVDSIYDVPLKRYGSIDKNLINQIDITKIPPINQSGNSGNATSGTGGESGSSGVSGVSPLINSILTLSANTNEWFNYTITATGTDPIRFEMIPDISGPISLTGNLITGFSGLDGHFNIILKAINSYGFDTKTLVVEIKEPPKIISSLVATCKKSNLFTYKILSSGASPKTYSVTGLSAGLSLNGDIISGTPLTSGVYNISLTVTNSYGTDTKILVLTVGTPPIITSSGSVTASEGDDFTYTITSSGGYPTDIKYSVTGTLQEGLSSSNYLITGNPAYGIKTVTLHASNLFGESTKQLTINIIKIHP